MLESVSFAILLALLASPAHAQWTLTQGGSSGVAGMQLTVATQNTVVIMDKLEKNPLMDNNGRHALGAIYNVKSDTTRPLHLVTNTFCASGTWLSNGTLINVGGNPRVDIDGHKTDNGLQGVRLFDPCGDNEKCDIYESPDRIRLTSARWYPSSARLSDGSSVIFGGAHGGGWTNFQALNNPTYEFFPPKNINGYNGMSIPSKFLEDSLPHNMYPHIILLPNNQLFIAANNMAMMFNWETDKETRLPNLPSGQRVVYPMSGVGVLLPLTPENSYTPEVMLCGGSELSDTLKEYEVSSKSPTSRQCSRLRLDSAGIAAGWTTELMPEGRVMADAAILPDGKVLILNGAKTGVAGYGNVPDQVGLSNADNPAFTPVLYDPSADPGKRFTSAGMPTSKIARLYHSSSTLLPDGRIMIAGSNPNLDVEERTYRTEYQVEYISPPYMNKARPTFSALPKTWNYGEQIALNIALPLSLNPPIVTVSLMDLGFSTHGVHMDMRMVKLKATISPNKKMLMVTGPPSATIYPPGPAWVYVLFNGIPSVAQRVLIGTGASPPVDQGAIDNMLAHTGGP